MTMVLTNADGNLLYNNETEDILGICFVIVAWDKRLADQEIRAWTNNFFSYRMTDRQPPLLIDEFTKSWNFVMMAW